MGLETLGLTQQQLDQLPEHLSSEMLELAGKLELGYRGMEIDGLDKAQRTSQRIQDQHLDQVMGKQEAEEEDVGVSVGNKTYNINPTPSQDDGWLKKNLVPLIVGGGLIATGVGVPAGAMMIGKAILDSPPVNKVIDDTWKDIDLGGGIPVEIKLPQSQ